MRPSVRLGAGWMIWVIVVWVVHVFSFRCERIMTLGVVYVQDKMQLIARGCLSMQQGLDDLQRNERRLGRHAHGLSSQSISFAN